jgi:TolB-like protein/DNA-binding winged helix-turn-helix (wHTH) protein/tetratricopeptide (TPR) repeat protein
MTSPGGAPAPGRYRFDDIVVDQAAHTLLRAGEPQAIEPKAFAVLLALLRHPGELVARDDLLDEVWGHRHVTPGVLTRAIAQLRAALGDEPQKPRYIATQHAVGYRFIGAMEAESGASQNATVQSAGSMIGTNIAPAETPSAAGATEDAGPARTIALPGRGRSWGWLAAAAILAVGLAVALWQIERRVMPPRPAASIAVLPFTSLSDDRGDLYFAEGLAVEIHDALAGVPGLTVAGRMSADQARGRDFKEIGQSLGVATVLDASVRRQGPQLRINARLSDAATGYTLWSRSYDRQLADVFRIQTEIAGEVAGSLTRLLPESRQALVQRLAPTKNVAAFDAYLRGLQQLLDGSGGDPKRAAGFFNRALAADRGFARAQAGICRSEVAIFETRRDAGAYARAQQACGQAEKLGPGLSEVSLAQAELHYARGDIVKAVEYYAKAERDPARRPAVYVGLAMVHGDGGRRQRSLDYFAQAQALRPGDKTIHALSGYYSYLAGDMKAAIASYRKAIGLVPHDAELWNMLGMMHMVAGDNAESARALRTSIALEPNYAALSNLGELEFQAGNYAASAALSRRAIALEPDDFLPWGNLGDALRADPKTRPQCREAYREAAERTARYLRIKPDDAKAMAALGWYRSNLGETSSVRELISRSDALGSEPAEVALFNAQTLVVLGEIEQARLRIAAGRAAGLPNARIASNPVLRSAGLYRMETEAARANSLAPKKREGRSTGD